MIRNVTVIGSEVTFGIVLVMPDGTHIAAQAGAEIVPYIRASIEAESRRWVRGTVFCETGRGADRVKLQVGDRFRYWAEPDNEEGPSIDLTVKAMSPEGEITLQPETERDVTAINEVFPQTEFVRGQRQSFRRVGTDLLTHESWTCWMQMSYRGGPA